MTNVSAPMPLVFADRSAGGMRVALHAQVHALAPPRSRLVLMRPSGPVARYEELKVFDAPGGTVVLRSNLVARDNDNADGIGGEILFSPAVGGSGARDGLTYYAPVVGIHRLNDVLRQVLGEGLTLRRHRETYSLGRAEVHLDQILKLGNFVHIEIAIDHADDAEAARKDAAALRARLALECWGSSMVEQALASEPRLSSVDVTL